MTAPTLLPITVVDEERPRVSIVMPTYNRAELMRESVKMLQHQTLQDFELIISDDHSTDHTPQVAAEISAADPRMRYHRPAFKGGINKVVNEAISLSRGCYIQICHDHDIYTPTMIEKLVGVMDRHPAVVFAHPGRQGCDHLGKPLPNAYFVCGYPEAIDGEIWRRKMLRSLACPVIGLSMIRRSALEIVGLFDPVYGASSDVDMWLKLCAVGDVGYVNEVLLYVRGREPGHPYAGVNWTIKDEVIRIHRKHLQLCYSGWGYWYWKIRRELEIDCHLTLTYLNCFRRRRWEAVTHGRVYLRRHGILLSRFMGWIL